MNTILIAYATWTGATRTVAETIAEELKNPETGVAVVNAGKMKDIGPYQAVVVCASVHMGQLPGGIKRFIQSNRKRLAGIPVAYCIVCLAAADGKEESRKAVEGYVDKMRQLAPEIHPVVETAVFGGAVLTDTPEFKHLFPLLKAPARSIAAQPDRRDWEAIRGWAAQIAPLLNSHG